MEDRFGFQRFVDEIHAASDEGGLVGAASRMADRMGYRWIAYLSMTDAQEHEITSTYAPPWVEHYFANNYEQIDPCVLASREQSQPFRWGSLGPPIEIPENVLRLYDDARSYGIRAGITIPILGPSGRWSAFTMATDESETEALARQTDYLTSMMTMMALQFHARLLITAPRFSAETRPKLLTDVQARCLQAVANGEPMKVAAHELGLTHRTVIHHLNMARKRLGAKNITHTVKTAFHLGLIK
ncbi:helix-turn-helix transcriptional regulator [Methylobacterium nodulans]|uniref:Transcriptional regulator, LuxR family n=1 Tax=Methylobacterium nodulans (strain LMG 21967 / CNCM I-2342 / ORS 2060) TaxID=460265 RepID=B8IHS1_METNO|nr:autoinducer binding domain-containing protein [Methylobacterium nodulans]ACL55959.1 transcriptional regulator, LuxR family [Methylobacterium nodulans ORS 2060]